MGVNAILDVAIGMFFLYLLLSLMCSAIQEFLAALFAMRANNLEAGIRNLLEDPNAVGIADKVLVHPLIARLAKGGKKPSYIPSRAFALALMDSLGSKDSVGAAPVPAAGDAAAPTPAAKDTAVSASVPTAGPVATLTAAVAELPEGPLKTSLTALIADAQGDVDRIRGNIETWFDDKMDRVSGWYKRKVKLIMLGIALVLAVGLNVDSIHVANALWRDPGLRALVVAQAQAEVAQNPKDGKSIYKDTSQQLKNLTLPIGWYGSEQGKANSATASIVAPPRDFGPTTPFGWLITAICVSLGAPFWFDALEKALNIRAAGNKPQRSAASG